MITPYAARSTPPPHDTGPRDVRLAMKPGPARGGYVDGAWWPRTRDLRSELPGLVAELATRAGSPVGPILRIGFGLAQWEHAGREKLSTPGGRVALGGFTTFQPDVVWLSGHTNARLPLVLLVVPPETPEHRATAALRRAGTAGNAERAAELLDDGVSTAPTAAHAAVATPDTVA